MREIRRFGPDQRREQGTFVLHSLYRVVDHFLGYDWLKLYVLYGAKRKCYLTMRPQMIGGGIGVDKDHTHRMLSLAECLLNSQSVEGFDVCVDSLFNGRIESTIAELQIGASLYMQGTPFRFIRPTGRLGSDYDFEIEYGDGITACADVKCKIEGSEYDAKKILNVLKKGRGQLPDDKPGVLFVKVPMDWVDPRTGAVNLAHQVADILDQFFRATGAIVLVVFYVVMIIDREQGSSIQHITLERQNAGARFQREAGWKLYEPVGNPLNWIRLMPLIEEAFGAR